MRKSEDRRKLRTSYATTIISISLVLFLLGIIGFLLLNANRLSLYVKENLGFTVLIKDNAREAEVKMLQKILSTTPYARSAEYIDKNKAAEKLKEDLGEDFVEFVGYNPLLASIEVKLAAQWANPDSMQVIETEIMKFPNVKELYYQRNLLHLVNENIRNITFILGLFSLLLLLIAIALINNTIRLSTYAKRFLIRTMQLVGASRGFIRKPFILLSILHGLAGATIAITLLSALIYYLNEEINGIVGFSDVYLIGILFVFVTLIGILITFISTFFAVNKYLRIKTDKLYY
jgi:cell division transport system permease protein